MKIKEQVLKEKEYLYKICRIKTKEKMYPVISANSQIKKAIALAFRFSEKKTKEQILKEIEENKQPTRKQGFQVFTMCFISLIVGMMYGSIDDMYVTLASQIGLIILGFVIFGLLLVCFKWFSKSVKGGKK